MPRDFPTDFILRVRERHPAYRQLTSCDSRKCAFCTRFPAVHSRVIHVVNTRDASVMRYHLIQEDADTWGVVGHRLGTDGDTYILCDTYERGRFEHDRWFRSKERSEPLWRGNASGRQEIMSGGRWTISGSSGH